MMGDGQQGNVSYDRTSRKEQGMTSNDGPKWQRHGKCDGTGWEGYSTTQQSTLNGNKIGNFYRKVTKVGPTLDKGEARADSALRKCY